MNQFDEMQNFIRIVESGSITKAANQINTVKSAVSRKLSELERRLGAVLLTRTTRSQSLTDTGKSYYLRSKQILDEVSELESTIKDEQCALRGKIKIAAPLSFGLLHLGKAISQFNQINPDIQIDIDFNDRKVDIVEEGYDMAFRISQLNDSNLIARKITHIQLHLLGSPGYLAQFGTPIIPEDLKHGHRKVQYKESPESWDFKVNNSLKSIKIPTVLRSNNGDYLCQAAVDGRGLILSPDFISYKHVNTGNLVPILTEFLPDNTIGAYVVYPQSRHLSRRVRSLVDYLIEFYGSKPYWQLKKLSHKHANRLE